MGMKESEAGKDLVDPSSSGQGLFFLCSLHCEQDLILSCQLNIGSYFCPLFSTSSVLLPLSWIIILSSMQNLGNIFLLKRKRKKKFLVLTSLSKLLPHFCPSDLSFHAIFTSMTKVKQKMMSYFQIIYLVQVFKYS